MDSSLPVRRPRAILTILTMAAAVLALAACQPQDDPSQDVPAGVVPTGLVAIAHATGTDKVQEVDAVVDHDEVQVTAVMVADGRAVTWAWDQDTGEVQRSPDEERATSGPRFWITVMSMSEAFTDVPPCEADRATWHGLALGGFLEPQVDLHCGTGQSAAHWYAIGGEQIDPATIDLDAAEGLDAEVRRGRQLLIEYDVSEVQVELDEEQTLRMTGAAPAEPLDGSGENCWPQYVLSVTEATLVWDLRCVPAPSVWGLGTAFDAGRALSLYEQVRISEQAAGAATAAVLSYSTENDEPVYTVRLGTGTVRTFDADGTALT
ncbi:hypothetical protein [Ruania albidiflava]|uniref:hypothetical protein n=1 Tax=Ruania albidiflava TaxID=366586 RepID=UPI0023F594FF|nr:hypothetical protein [Ruania albidiflava]